VTFLFSSLVSYGRGNPASRVAVGPEWQEALTWLRENTPEDGENKVMTWWDYGYWILDVAHRVPVVDNGIHWASYDRDIAKVYCTDIDDDAVETMRRYKACYLIFSDDDIAILPIIISEAAAEVAKCDGTSIPPELRDSIFARSLGGQTEFGGALRRVYPADDVANPSVVILALE